MKKLLPILISAILSGMTLNSAFAAGADDVGTVTMDVIDHSDPHEITNDIQLPEQASETAKDQLSGDSDSHDKSTEVEAHEDTMGDAKDDAMDDAKDDAMDDATENAKQEAQDAMQDSKDTANSTGQ